MTVAVITARGGSKRIPGKNIRAFAGKPMLVWPIEAAKESGIFERIIVSTDSPAIAEVAVQWGAEVPFMRPAELADDHTPTAPVFLHALKFLENDTGLPEYACCIYPTAPFLSPRCLAQGLEELRKYDAPAAISVTTFAFPVLRAFKICDDGAVAFNWPEYEYTRSQDLPEFYHDAGQFYWVNVQRFCKEKRLVMPGTRPVVLPRKLVQDIDTPEDWEAAVLMARVMLHGDSHP
jgi:pseudaminic acid cytidylyltransferase